MNKSRKVEELRKAQELAELKAYETMVEMQRNKEKLRDKDQNIETLQNQLKEQIDQVRRQQEIAREEAERKNNQDMLLLLGGALALLFAGG